jgi:hypothetical protein
VPSCATTSLRAETPARNTSGGKAVKDDIIVRG